MNKSLYKSLQKRYGGRAKEVYYKMESEWHKATSKEAIAKSKKDHPEYYTKKKKSRILTVLYKTINDKK